MDRNAELKSEYHDGEVFPIEGVTLGHGMIASGTAWSLRSRLGGTPCRVASSPVRVKVSPTKFVYPDLLVFCGKPLLMDDRSDTITNPKVIIEILSPSTEGYDYRKKFSLYRLLPSFEEYVLIAQDEPRIDVFRKAPNDEWILATYQGSDSIAKLQSLGIELPLAELYAGVLE